MFYIYGRYPRWEDEVPLFLGLANAAANISVVVVGVFRCRDLGWSGWRVLAFVVPIANLILILILMFRPGAVHSSRPPSAAAELRVRHPAIDRGTNGIRS